MDFMAIIIPIIKILAIIAVIMVLIFITFGLFVVVGFGYLWREKYGRHDALYEIENCKAEQLHIADKNSKEYLDLERRIKEAEEYLEKAQKEYENRLEEDKN